jgi:hypothetical protein
MYVIFITQRDGYYQSYVRILKPRVYAKQKLLSDCAERNAVLGLLIKHTNFDEPPVVRLQESWTCFFCSYHMHIALRLTQPPV